jgi:hypothetical protein
VVSNTNAPFTRENTRNGNISAVKDAQSASRPPTFLILSVPCPKMSELKHRGLFRSPTYPRVDPVRFAERIVISTYLLTVSNAWLHKGTLRRDFLLRNAAEFERAATLAPFSWPVRHQADMAPGDVVYLLLQGDGSRGIIASGRVISGDLKTEKHWNKPWDEVTTVDFQWDTTVLPDEALDTEFLRNACPQTNWIPRAKSTAVAIDEVDVLAEEWAVHLSRLGYKSHRKERRREIAYKHVRKIPDNFQSSVVTARSHYRAFRWDLIELFGAKCDYCGLSDLTVLEAVHLIPPALGGASTPSNGRLLCANHHRAFAQGILKWDREGRFIQSAPWLRIPPPAVHTRLAEQVFTALTELLRAQGDDTIRWYRFPVPLTLSAFVKLCQELELSAPEVLDHALRANID